MTVKRMDHTGVVVEDLAQAVAFFLALGLETEGETTVEGDWVGRVIGLEGVRAKIAMLQTPEGQRCVELSQFLAPPSHIGGEPALANAPGIRHLSFVVEDIDPILARLRDEHGAELIGEVVRYRDSYKLCYLRGPAGIIVELAQELG